ncbi:MAG: LysE family transporter [Candidatus Kariarchaeaceae archaeon]|jgi:threonine/homoserine/homoserine lactone efflux protein
MITSGDIVFLMLLGFSLAAPLGPVNVEMIKRALASRFGFILGIFTGLGAMTGDFIVAFSVLFVGDEYLREIISQLWVFIPLLIFNFAFLSYIGISALKSEETEITVEASEGGVAPVAIVRQAATGFVIVVTSPWSYFWWTSFGGYIINSGLPLDSSQERLIVTFYFLGGILAWVVLFNLILGISQRMASPKVLNLITKTSALVIIGFAIYILGDGLYRLFTGQVV